MLSYNIIAYLVCINGNCPLHTNHTLYTYMQSVNSSLAKVTNYKYIANSITIKSHYYNGDEQGIALEQAASQTPHEADHKLFFLPNHNQPSAIGWAQVNGNKAVFNTFCHNSISCVLHEMGHNLGLNHANKFGKPYADTSSLMGYSLQGNAIKGYNAPNLFRLNIGIATPLYKTFNTTVPILNKSFRYLYNGNLFFSRIDNTGWNANASLTNKLLIHTLDNTQTNLVNILEFNTCTNVPINICTKYDKSFLYIWSVPGDGSLTNSNSA